MDVSLDVDTHILTGTQVLTYFNNSPDTLSRVFYHLYYNAFQPGSMMDKRSRTIIDPDRRVLDRIYHLNELEIGYQKINSLTQNGVETSYRTEGTVLIVDLPEPILPGDSTIFEMDFEAQVPVQIRRTGRDNREGIKYSMAQWYPRMAEFDQDGWHTHPYVAREFHGVWGDFDVRITIDRNFTVGGTGYLQNPQEIGHGYEDPELPLEVPDTETLTWHFYAPDVIDFMWGAHDEFIHEIVDMDDGPRIHLLYVPAPETRNWEVLGDFTAEAIRFINDYIGEYPYDQFSIIQAGDGGMEYPMATLITGHRSLYSLTAVTVHELVHMWFQTLLATNESLHHWMDEGFTVYLSSLVMQHLFQLSGDPHAASYMSYLRLNHDQLEERMDQHADWYETNAAYSMASYRKGALFLHQLEYIVGEETLKRSLQRYFQDWKYRHPTPTDFQRIVERKSNMQLGWYFELMMQTTRTIDLAIDRVRRVENETEITLKNKSNFLMPVDVLITYADGTEELLYIPRHEMLEVKPNESFTPENRTNLDAWFWTHPTYTFTIPVNRSSIERIEIDPTNRLADVNRLNNIWPNPYTYRFLDVGRQNWNRYEIGYRPAIWYGQNSGLMLGGRMAGMYLFGTKQLEASFMLTSGNIEDQYSLGGLDVDYNVSFRDRWRFLGPEGWWYFQAERFYGIDQQRLGISKQLGRYGRLERTRRIVDVSAFHLRRTASRNIPVLDALWDRGSLAGISIGFEFERPKENGFSIEVMNAVYGTTMAAHQVNFKANRTYSSSDRRLSSRFGINIGGGSVLTPNLMQYNLPQGSAYERWNNKTWWSFANISPDLNEDLNLVFDSGNALSAYTLAGSANPNTNGNNKVSFTIWNSFRPFTTGNLRPFSLEAFAGTGKAWFGSFIDGISLPDEDSPWLATMGGGVLFDFSELPGTNRWTGQSHFLNNLKLSVRTPFYTHNPADGDEWKIRLMFGVSQAF